MKVLLTGATGFIGRHCHERLLDNGYQITGVSLNDAQFLGHKIIGLNLNDPKEVKNFFRNREFDCIVHLAAQVPKSFQKEKIAEVFLNNFNITASLLEQFAKFKAKTFIHASSITADLPDNLYSLGKKFEEDLGQFYAQKSNKKIVSLRISAPYGPGQNIETVIPLFIKKAFKNQPLTIFGRGSRSQDFIYVKNITEAILGAIKAKKSGVYSVGSGQSVSTLDLARLIIEKTNSKSKIIFKGKDSQENYMNKVDIKLIQKDLGFQPISIARGLELYIEFLREKN